MMSIALTPGFRARFPLRPRTGLGAELERSTRVRGAPRAGTKKDGQAAPALGKLLFELGVVFHRHRNGAYGKNGVESRHALTF